MEKLVQSSKPDANQTPSMIEPDLLAAQKEDFELIASVYTLPASCKSGNNDLFISNELYFENRWKSSNDLVNCQILPASTDFESDILKVNTNTLLRLKLVGLQLDYLTSLLDHLRYGSLVQLEIDTFEISANPVPEPDKSPIPVVKPEPIIIDRGLNNPIVIPVLPDDPPVVFDLKNSFPCLKVLSIGSVRIIGQPQVPLPAGEGPVFTFDAPVQTVYLGE